MYAHLKKIERRNHNQMYDLAKMVCSFVNYNMAKAVFTEPETVENTGFLDDLKKLDPNFDEAKYSEYLDTEK